MGLEIVKISRSSKPLIEILMKDSTLHEYQKFHALIVLGENAEQGERSLSKSTRYIS